MTTTITIGHGEFAFSAAHSGVHAGQFERLHGHTYIVELHLTGTLDKDGMIADFAAVKGTLRAALAPLRKRTLFASDTPGVTIEHAGSQVVIRGAGKVYNLPADDVMLLPTTSTSTEAIAGYLLDQIVEQLRPTSGLAEVELQLTESLDSSVRVKAPL
ncbi:6-carboxytetrahydropterin synthase [Kribbella sp. NPDC023972]|uniref:6-pyruvoyl trahydropterin synthase family protein n=1 Tax=Kribbella sp. NPDC023972 TaxID=3154795 RepID=UPI0033DE5A24